MVLVGKDASSRSTTLKAVDFRFDDNHRSRCSLSFAQFFDAHNGAVKLELDHGLRFANGASLRERTVDSSLPLQIEHHPLHCLFPAGLRL
jgi:hypothetical protein